MQSAGLTHNEKKTPRGNKAHFQRRIKEKNSFILQTIKH